MSTSIYYSAKRNEPMTLLEHQHIQSILDDYNENYPYRDEEETLSLYSEPSSGYILEGSTKLPLYDENMLIDSVNYWLEALAKLKFALPSAQWEISIDDCTASWVDDHWEM
ncbi:hypothetical protein V4841_20315 [Lelliottia amnigena]|jgi:hypothetical protein|uniref:DUF2528 domain-containing protein n=1 Tax=Lelliottia amnigena TaxID=61646 RepID=A0ABU7U7Z3_LELAM|nr:MULTISPECIES: hypothetical protein [Enterobacteriaceae]QLX27025.1 hypothetical protein HV271_20435 [Citrobacter freundii]QMB07740.1 hypothetical protein HV011_19970 [Citrobacter freundii]QXB20121.1 hypothetical protein I6L76_12795 [Lelliottia amnigena]